MSNVLDFNGKRYRKLALEQAMKEAVVGNIILPERMIKIGCSIPLYFKEILAVILMVSKNSKVDSNSIEVFTGKKFERVGEGDHVLCGLSQMLVNYGCADSGSLCLLFNTLIPTYRTVTPFGSGSFKMVLSAYAGKCSEYSEYIEVVPCESR